MQCNYYNYTTQDLIWWLEKKTPFSNRIHAMGKWSKMVGKREVLLHWGDPAVKCIHLISIKPMIIWGGPLFWMGALMIYTHIYIYIHTYIRLEPKWPSFDWKRPCFGVDLQKQWCFPFQNWDFSSVVPKIPNPSSWIHLEVFCFLIPISWALFQKKGEKHQGKIRLFCRFTNTNVHRSKIAENLSTCLFVTNYHGPSHYPHQK